MRIKPSRSNQLMVENDGSAFAKELLGRNNKIFIGLPSHLWVSWRKILYSAGALPNINIFLQLTIKYDIRCEEDQ